MKKPVIAIDLSTTGKGGGPYTSTQRIINSKLNEKYNFRILYYKTELGRFISFWRIRDLTRQLKIIDPDIVHFTGLQLSGFQIALACKLAGIRNTVMTVRGFSGDMIYLHSYKKLIVSFIIEPLTLLLTKNIYGNSEYVSSRKVLRLFKYKLNNSIYNYPPNIYKSDNSDDIRKELGISCDDNVVVSVARINKDKGYSVLTKAIMMCSRIEKLKFIIVGKGEYLQEMKNRLKNQIALGQVFFLGYRSDVQRILSGCNIFVLPTLHETLSGVLLESSVEGLALIASNTGGIPEIIENEYNGLLVPPGNVDLLFLAIKRIHFNNELREFLGANAKEKIKKDFSPREIDKKINDIYKSLL